MIASMSLRILFVSGLLLLAACGHDAVVAPSGSTATMVDVFMIGDVFSPAFTQITANDTVRFNFSGGSDGMGHDVIFDPTAAGRPADIPAQKSGTVLRVFSVRGIFRYDCKVHPGMSGQVSVQ
jgi:plastocyanin